MVWKIPDSVKAEQADELLDEFTPMPVDQRPPMATIEEFNGRAKTTAGESKQNGEAQKREERLRIASRNGTVIPRPDDPPRITQRQYDDALIHAKCEMLTLENEARAKHGDRPIVRGCTTCDPTRRQNGPDCVGACELKWR